MRHRFDTVMLTHERQLYPAQLSTNPHARTSDIGRSALISEHASCCRCQIPMPLARHAPVVRPCHQDVCCYKRVHRCMFQTRHAFSPELTPPSQETLLVGRIWRCREVRNIACSEDRRLDCQAHRNDEQVHCSAQVRI